MNSSSLWNALRARLGAQKQARGTVALQHLGLSTQDLGDLRAVLARIGQELDVSFELHGHTGDLVLLDVPFASRLSPQLVHAFAEGRPVVLVGGTPADQDPALSTLQRLEQRQQSLLRQLREIALVRTRSGRAEDSGWGPSDLARSPASRPWGEGAETSGFDPQFDSRIDTHLLQSELLQQDQQDLLNQVMQRLVQTDALPLSASYGADANLLFDFRARLVFIDPMAQQHLRVRRELPQAAPGARTQAEALVRELDETLWDLGMAAGPFALLDQPVDWWHRELRLLPDARIDRHSRLPRHLDLARRLSDGPCTPSELRRHARVGVLDLRRFIQASLILQLVEWAPQAPTPASAAIPGAH